MIQCINYIQFEVDDKNVSEINEKAINTFLVANYGGLCMEIEILLGVLT